jgi:hypothetical protein|tara:strand:- start:14274 stop:14651 length:378 start_codon:yes stop_codon:yes gene_type:complete
MAAKEKGQFDLNKYQINPQAKVVTVTIEGTNDEFNVTIKQLAWARRNALISSCIAWTTDGSTSFQGDTYVRECLKEMIIEAPWGKTTEAFLMSIDERLGNALEKLVPSAFSDEGGVSPDEIKKES